MSGTASAYKPTNALRNIQSSLCVHAYERSTKCPVLTTRTVLPATTDLEVSFRVAARTFAQVMRKARYSPSAP
eukprot:2144693-Rhodomonas_salina.5